MIARYPLPISSSFLEKEEVIPWMVSSFSFFHSRCFLSRSFCRICNFSLRLLISFLNSISISSFSFDLSLCMLFSYCLASSDKACSFYYLNWSTLQVHSSLSFWFFSFSYFIVLLRCPLSFWKSITSFAFSWAKSSSRRWY